MNKRPPLRATKRKNAMNGIITIEDLQSSLTGHPELLSLPYEYEIKVERVSLFNFAGASKRSPKDRHPGALFIVSNVSLNYVAGVCSLHGGL